MTVLKPKKIISLLLAVCMTLTLISTSLCTTASAASKTVIKTVDDLKNISKNLSGTYELGANIDCKGVSMSPIGNLAKPFTGTFTCPTGANGKPTYAITNLTINVKIGGDRKSQQGQYKANGDSNWCVGLFGAAKDAKFQNIVVLNANVSSDVIGGSDTGSSYSETYKGTDEQGTGIMCGIAVGTTFKNCGVQGTVTSASNNVGGFVGQAGRTVNSTGNGNKPLMSGKSGTTAQNCYAYANVNSTGSFQWNAGGFVGNATKSTFTGSFFEGTLAVTTGTSMAAGGFVGCISSSTFKACYSAGSFTQGGYYPGAFAGQFTGHNAAADRCKQCYSNIKMSGTPFSPEANDKSGNFLTPNVGGSQEGFAVKSVADINAKFASNTLWNTYGDGATLPTVKALTGKTVKTLADLGVVEGTSGDCVWKIEDGRLIISGNGRMGESTWNRHWIASVTIEDNVTSISDSAFSGCTELTSIDIPDSVVEIGVCAFSNCTALTSVTLPGSLRAIGSSAFSGCTNLSGINIPERVKDIGNSAFSGCTNLTEIKVDKNNKKYCSVDGVLYNKDKTELMSFPAGKVGDFIIPDSVISIDGRAFYGCTGLTGITIPDSVTSISDSALDGCSGLTSITIPDSVTSIGWHAFEDCVNLTSVTVPNGVTSIGNKSFAGCKNLRTIVIPESVTSIADNAFNESYLVTIKTTENSAAHKYALENDIDFELIEPVTVEGDDKNITISTDNSVIPSAGVSLSTEKVENIGEKYEAKLKNLGTEKFTAYNIDLMKDDAKIQPNGKVTVGVAVPDGMDGAKCKVYRAETDGTLTDMGAVFENGKFAFKTDHFSLYIIAQFAVKPGDVTGDGVVNSGDAIEVLRHDAKSVMLTDAQLAAANVDGNDRVDSNDAILILQYDAKAISKFPIE